MASAHFYKYLHGSHTMQHGFHLTYFTQQMAETSLLEPNPLSDSKIFLTSSLTPVSDSIMNSAFILDTSFSCDFNDSTFLLSLLSLMMVPLCLLFNLFFSPSPNLSIPEELFFFLSMIQLSSFLSLGFLIESKGNKISIHALL